MPQIITIILPVSHFPENGRREAKRCNSFSSAASSNASTWRRSSFSSDDEDDSERCSNKTAQQIRCVDAGMGTARKCENEEDGMSAAEEAVAMAVVLAGNGTLPNRKKVKPAEWDDREENELPEMKVPIKIYSHSWLHIALRILSPNLQGALR